MARGDRHVVPGAKPGLDDLKRRVTRDLGLDDDIKERGWEDMTTREAGKVGGNMVRRMVKSAEKRMDDGTERTRRDT